MNLEDFREILQNMTDVKITNTLLSKALDMKLPSITRKIKDKSDVKLVQIKRLEKFFDVDLSQYYDVYIYQNDGNNKQENYNFDEFYENGSLYERLEYLLQNNRVKPGMTFYRLSQVLGVPTAKFTEIKTGRVKKLSQDIALKISCIFGVSLKWLFTGEGEVFEETFDLKKRNLSGVEDNFKQAFKNFGKIQEINDLTDGEMAKILGMPEHKYVKIASGKDKITMDVVLKLKENFNVNVDAFLFKKEKVNSGEELTLTKDEVVKLKSFLNRF